MQRKLGKVEGWATPLKFTKFIFREKIWTTTSISSWWNEAPVAKFEGCHVGVVQWCIQVRKFSTKKGPENLKMLELIGSITICQIFVQNSIRNETRMRRIDFLDVLIREGKGRWKLKISNSDRIFFLDFSNLKRKFSGCNSKKVITYFWKFSNLNIQQLRIWYRQLMIRHHK